MKNVPLIVTVSGLAAAFYAVMLNLVTATVQPVYTVQSLIFAVVAIVCGVWCVRRGGGYRFAAIAMIGPAVFILADAGTRLALLLSKH